MRGLFSTLPLALSLLAAAASGAGLAPEMEAKVQAKAKQLQWMSTDPKVVEAVKEHNANPSAEVKAMTAEKWKGLTLLDPFVRSFSKTPLAEYLKGKKDEATTELFVSGADGAKVAFFSKPTNWTHKGKDKHDVPMKGKVWVGAVEVDQSTGQEQVQVGLPVLDKGKAIGSIVVGLATAKIK